MHNPKKRSSPSSQKLDWLKYINDCLPALVIPVGPRFQANVPEWTGTSSEHYANGNSDTSKWLGTKIWPLENNPKDLKDNIGKGRPDTCRCSSPGSSYCVNKHVSEARIRLKSSLGPAFTSWKFNEMGDEVGKLWSSKQKKRFDIIVKTNPLSQAKSFLQPAVSSFPSKTREEIVNYYLSVYVPKRISMVTRSGITVLDSDDDEVDEEALNANNSLKRARPDSTDDNTKLVKSHYLTGRR